MLTLEETYCTAKKTKRVQHKIMSILLCIYEYTKNDVFCQMQCLAYDVDMTLT